MQTYLSVVIPTYNRVNILRGTIEALFNQSLNKECFEIIVVDDGSEDETNGFLDEIVRQNTYNIRTYRQENGLAGSARNLGIKEARGPLILLIDDDIKADRDLLKNHLEVHTNNPELEVAVLGRLITTNSSVDLIRADKYNSIKADKQTSRIDAGYFVTANISVKRQFILQAGSFTPGLVCLQDTDLALRLKKIGLQLMYNPKAVGTHMQPIDTLGKVISSGEKYGRTSAEWYDKMPHFQDEIMSFGGRLNGGWDQLIHQPWQYFIDGIRRWTINKYTVSLILQLTSKIPITNPPKRILIRLCKEIWSYYFRHEFKKMRSQLNNYNSRT